MEALLSTFIAAALAEFGDKTQLLAVALAVRYRRPGAVLLGVATAAFANTVIAAFGGTLVHDVITLRAISLLVAVALLYAGVAGLIRQNSDSAVAMGSTWKTGPFVTSAVCFFLLEFGDKSQFLTFAIAAQYDALILAAAGATLGVVAANLPAVILAERSSELLRLKTLRLGLALLFLLVGSVVAISALRLV